MANRAYSTRAVKIIRTFSATLAGKASGPSNESTQSIMEQPTGKEPEELYIQRVKEEIEELGI
jgi:hypothetical protein